MKKHILSLSERVSATFLFAFLGVVSVSGGHDLFAVKAGAVAGGLSVAKYLYTVTGEYLNTPTSPPTS